MAGFKAYSETVGIFQIHENFFGDRVRKNDAYKPDLIPQNDSRAEKSAKLKSNFQHGITFSKMIFFSKTFLHFI